MANYAIRTRAEDWFKKLGYGDTPKPPFKTKFDFYYLCAMMGLAARRPSPSESTREIDIRSVPQDYKDTERLLQGLLLDACIQKLGLQYSDKNDVRKELAVNLDDQTGGLTADGFRHLNAYASGGFDILVEHIVDPPDGPESFLQQYVRCLTKNAKS